MTRNYNVAIVNKRICPSRPATEIQVLYSNFRHSHLQFRKSTNKTKRSFKRKVRMTLLLDFFCICILCLRRVLEIKTARKKSLN